MSLFQTDTDLTIIDVHTDSNPQRQLPPIRSGQLIIVDNGDVYFDNYQNKRVKINSSSSSGGASLSGLTECELGLLMYGDASIVPSPEEWFIAEGDTITALSSEAMNESEIIIPYKIGDTYIKHIGTGYVITSEVVPTAITSVFVPRTVETIAKNAFSECHAIEYVKLANKCTRVNATAFHGLGIVYDNAFGVNMTYGGRLSLAMLDDNYLPATADMVGTVYEITESGQISCNATINFTEEYNGQARISENNDVLQLQFPGGYTSLNPLLEASEGVELYTSNFVNIDVGELIPSQTSQNVWTFSKSNTTSDLVNPLPAEVRYIKFINYTIEVSAGDLVVWTGTYWKKVGSSDSRTRSGAAEISGQIIIGTAEDADSCNMVCDNTNAVEVINAAIHTFSDLTGGTVKLLPGVYYIDGDINMDVRNVKLCGDGKSALFIRGNHGVRITADNCEVCDLTVESEDTNNYMQINVKGSIDGNGKISYCKRAMLHNLRMVGAYIDLEYTKDCIVSNNIIGRNWTIEPSSTLPKDSTGEVVQGYRDGICSSYGVGNLYTNNNVTSCYEGIIVSHEINSIISNNVANQINEKGISCLFSEHITINSNNLYTSTGGEFISGIAIFGSTKVIITSNNVYLDDCDGYIGGSEHRSNDSSGGIRVGYAQLSGQDSIRSKYVIIANNVVKSNSTKNVPPVKLVECDYITISQNMIMPADADSWKYERDVSNVSDSTSNVIVAEPLPTT